MTLELYNQCLGNFSEIYPAPHSLLLVIWIFGGTLYLEPGSKCDMLNPKLWQEHLFHFFNIIRVALPKAELQSQSIVPLGRPLWPENIPREIPVSAGSTTLDQYLLADIPLNTRVFVSASQSPVITGIKSLPVEECLSLLTTSHSRKKCRNLGT